MKKIGQLDRRVLRRTEETLVSDVSLIASGVFLFRARRAQKQEKEDGSSKGRLRGDATLFAPVEVK